MGKATQCWVVVQATGSNVSQTLLNSFQRCHKSWVNPSHFQNRWTSWGALECNQKAQKLLNYCGLTCCRPSVWIMANDLVHTETLGFKMLCNRGLAALRCPRLQHNERYIKRKRRLPWKVTRICSPPPKKTGYIEFSCSCHATSIHSKPTILFRILQELDLAIDLGKPCWHTPIGVHTPLSCNPRHLFNHLSLPQGFRQKELTYMLTAHQDWHLWLHSPRSDMENTPPQSGKANILPDHATVVSRR